MQISHPLTFRGEWLADEYVSNACLSQRHERTVLKVRLFPFIAVGKREHEYITLLFLLFGPILVDSVEVKDCHVVRLFVSEHFLSKSSVPPHEESFEAGVYLPSWWVHHVL